MCAAWEQTFVGSSCANFLCGAIIVSMDEIKMNITASGETGEVTHDEQIKALQTFESDVLEALKRSKTGAADIVMAQQARPRETFQQTIIAPQESSHPERSKLLMTISGVVVAAGIIVAGAYWFFKPNKPPPAPVTASGQQIIAIDLVKTIDVTNRTHNEVITAIQQERDAAALRVNATEAITFSENNGGRTPAALSAPEFLSRIAPDMYTAFGRALENEFVFGLIGYDGNQPFLILRTKAFENAYNGLLQGEVDLYRQAGPIFVPGKGALPGLSTSTLAYFGTDPQHQIFRDKVVSNLDARIVANASGKTVFLYAFADQATVVVTTNEKTFTEVVARLKRARLIN